MWDLLYVPVPKKPVIMQSSAVVWEQPKASLPKPHLLNSLSAVVAIASLPASSSSTEMPKAMPTANPKAKVLSRTQQRRGALHRKKEAKVVVAQGEAKYLSKQKKARRTTINKKLAARILEIVELLRARLAAEIVSGGPCC